MEISKKQSGAGPTFPCPICSRPVPRGAQQCPNPNCQVDLTPLAHLDQVGQDIYALALDQINHHALPEALISLETLLAFDPGHLDAWIVKAKLHSRAGQLDEAQRCWLKAEGLNPDDDRVKNGLAAVQNIKDHHARRIKRNQVLLGGIPALAAVLVMGSLFLFVRPVSAPAAPLTPAAQLPTSTPPPAAPTPDFVQAVSAQLTGDEATRNYAVKVSQQDAVIYLSGSIPSLAVKQKMEALVKHTAGVEGVDSSNLVVNPPSYAPVLAEKIKADARLAGFALQISEDAAVVKLKGTLPSAELKAYLAASAASWVENKTIDTQDILVNSQELAAQAAQALKQDPHTACFDLKVEQDGSAIQIGGSVYSAAARQNVETLARKTAGISLVDIGAVKVDPPYSEYVVKPGDNLNLIAQQVYGDYAKWALIYQTNTGIKYPIKAGDKLAIPPVDKNLGGLPIVDCVSHK